MDIANINALTRTGSYPSSRTARADGLGRADAGASITHIPARATPPPTETVVQGELLQKRRNVPLNPDYSLLNAMRTMDQLLRQSDAPADTKTTPARDARRALANYAANTLTAQNPTGSTASVFIDYFV
ncbi:MAG: hypothetical protein ACYC7I_05270 [Gammaproteobacteria bacterium]